MTVLKWPDDFNWPYAGIQPDVPVNFGRGMIKVEDQIYWLLNAVKLLNDAAVSMKSVIEYADSMDAKTLKAANVYTDSAVSHFDAALARLEEMVDSLNQNIAVTRNPVTGMNDYTYVALKQVFDACRPYTAVYNDIDTSEMTYNDLNDLSVSWFVFDQYSNVIINDDDTKQTHITPANRLTDATPGYYPDLFVHGSTYDEFDTYGFLYSRKGD